jgi:hypothetical protein
VLSTETLTLPCAFIFSFSPTCQRAMVTSAHTGAGRTLIARGGQESKTMCFERQAYLCHSAEKLCRPRTDPRKRHAQRAEAVAAGGAEAPLARREHTRTKRSRSALARCGADSKSLRARGRAEQHHAGQDGPSLAVHHLMGPGGRSVHELTRNK